MNKKRTQIGNRKRIIKDNKMKRYNRNKMIKMKGKIIDRMRIKKTKKMKKSDRMKLKILILFKYGIQIITIHKKNSTILKVFRKKIAERVIIL